MNLEVEKDRLLERDAEWARLATDVRFSPDGHLAYMFSRNAVTLNGPDGEPVTTTGRAVTIWRRDPDGIWRCAVDIWNAEPSAAV